MLLASNGHFWIIPALFEFPFATGQLLLKRHGQIALHQFSTIDTGRAHSPPGADDTETVKRAVRR